MEGIIDVDVVNKMERLIIAAHAKENAVIKVGDKNYWANSQNIVVDDPRHEKIAVSSLSAIVGYVKDNREGFNPEELFIHIQSPDQVVLMDKARKRNIRTKLMYAGLSYGVQLFHFEFFMNTEEFIIGLMSRFEDMGDRADIVAIASSLRSEKSLQADDNGATTKYEAKHGVVSLKGVKIPDVVNLSPFRTFRQVDQPESTFLFRYRAVGDGMIEVALFEADGGAWRHKAMASIEKYFKEALPKVQVIA